MKIRIFMASAKYHWERDVLRKWYDGITRQPGSNAHDVDFDYGERPEKNVDIGIIYGGARPTGKGIQEVRQNIINNCQTVIINETPLLGRTISKRHTWHRIGVGGHLYKDGDFNAVGKDNQRIDQYKNQWNLKFKPWRTEGDHIVLGLQLPGDSSLRKQDLSEWAISALDELLANTSKDIRIRTHPAFSEDDHCQIINLYKHVGKLGTNRVKFSYGNIVTWDQDLTDCYCVVTYSSGLSIDAIDNGVPVIATDQANFAYDISSRYMSEINNLKMISDQEKQQWYNDLSYCQWSSEEILAGSPWNHLYPAIERIIAKNQ
jgi:hypothetical protein